MNSPHGEQALSAFWFNLDNDTSAYAFHTNISTFVTDERITDRTTGSTSEHATVAVRRTLITGET
jgi:hypothetical protein